MNHKATENTKKKAVARRSSGCMPILKWVGVIIGFLAFLVFAYFGTLYLWLNQGEVRSSLPPELQATAEALLENPHVEPPLDDSEFYVGVTDVDRNAREICFVIASGDAGRDHFFDNGDHQMHVYYITIFINGELAGRAETGGWFLDMYRIWNGYTSACIDGILDDGLHLIELRAMDGAFGTPNYIKQWAIQVDCRYEGCVENAAPTTQAISEAEAFVIDPLPEELSSYTQNLLDNSHIYDGITFSMFDISVPTVSPTSYELCFDFRGIEGGLSINGTTHDQYGDVFTSGGEIDNQAVGTLTLNNESHTVFSLHFDDGVMCQNYRLQTGLVLIQLELDALEQTYEWAIEIE